MNKTLFLLILGLITGLASKSQIIPEYQYAGSATMTHLAISGDKYYLMDYYGNQCKIYNTDHTIWKTIDLMVPDGMYLYDIRYVTEQLFDTDNLVELVYIYYQYDTTLYYFTYYTRVIREDGSELLSIPGCNYVEVKATSTGSFKLLAYIYDYSVLPFTLLTGVYGLPGSLSSNGNFSEEINAGAGLPFPNPADAMVTIPVLMSGSERAGELILLNQAGQSIQRYRLQPGSSHIQIRTVDFQPGLYVYQVLVPGQAPSGGSFVIR